MSDQKKEATPKYPIHDNIEVPPDLLKETGRGLFARQPYTDKMLDPLSAGWNTQLAAEHPASSKEDIAALLAAIDFSQMNAVFKSFLQVVGLPVAIIDLDAHVLASSNWQRVCMAFHRVHPETLRRCIESDTVLATEMQAGQPFAIYRCRNGLIDCASPIVVEGKHIANLFIGQFFTSQPDTELFRAQQMQFGFDAQDYLSAIAEVPIIAEGKVRAILDMLVDMANLIAAKSLSEHRARNAHARAEQQVREHTAELQQANRQLEVELARRKRTEENLRASETQVRRKLDAILSPEANISDLELSDIIDSEMIQKLMDELYRVTNIGIGIIDLRGRVLAGTGWQDICTKFHRVNPESCRLCHESDLELSRNVPPGTFKQYRCKNNMWDIATPIMLAGKHVGNIFLGQFLFDDETPDYEIFRRQARQYGFDEQEYIAALDRAPRWSHELVNAVMTFYTDFAGLIGKLSYSNIKLASVLEGRTRAEQALKKLNDELDQKVTERTAALEAKIAEIERLNKMFVGRELRMIELKERIKELENRAATSKEG